MSMRFLICLKLFKNLFCVSYRPSFSFFLLSFAVAMRAFYNVHSSLLQCVFDVNFDTTSFSSSLSFCSVIIIIINMLSGRCYCCHSVFVVRSFCKVLIFRVLISVLLLLLLVHCVVVIVNGCLFYYDSDNKCP